MKGIQDVIEALKVMDLLIDDSKLAKESIVGTNISLGNFCLQDILKKGLPKRSTILLSAEWLGSKGYAL